MRVESIQLEKIDRGDRRRVDYKDVPALAASIEEKGLIHPIAVWERVTEMLEKEISLLCGGRRIKAYEYMKKETIPCRIYDQMLTSLEIKAIELAENVDREDFEYHEKIQLEKEIHELMLQIHGPKTSTKPDAKGHSLADTARLLNKTPAKLTVDMQIAKAMEEFPQLQWEKLKSREDAHKLVKKISTSMIRMDCAIQAEKEIGEGDFRKKKLYDSFIVGDFFEQAKQLPDNYFNIVEVDPPYAIDLQKKKKGYSYEGYNELPAEGYLDFVENVLRVAYRSMSEHSWIIWWFGPDNQKEGIGIEQHRFYTNLYNLITKTGFNTTGLVGIWVKGVDEGEGISATGQTHMPNSRLANAYEMFYYAWKGNPCLARPGQSNVFGYKPVPPGRKSHPTERPVDLISDILTTFGVEGSRVLVPFAGSGATLLAAAHNKMIPLGFDLTQAYKDSYILRVKEEF